MTLYPRFYWRLRGLYLWHCFLCCFLSFFFFIRTVNATVTNCQQVFTHALWERPQLKLENSSLVALSLTSGKVLHHFDLEAKILGHIFLPNNGRFQAVILDQSFFLRFFTWSYEKRRLVEVGSLGERVFVENEKSHFVTRWVFRKHEFKFYHPHFRTFDGESFVIYDELGAIAAFGAQGKAQFTVNLQKELKNRQLVNGRLLTYDWGHTWYYLLDGPQGPVLARISGRNGETEFYNVTLKTNQKLWILSENYILNEGSDLMEISFLQKNGDVMALGSLQKPEGSSIRAYGDGKFYLINGHSVVEYAFNGSPLREWIFPKEHGPIRDFLATTKKDHFVVDSGTNHRVLWNTDPLTPASVAREFLERILRPKSLASQ